MAIFGLDSPNAVIGVAIAYSISQYYIVWHAWFRLRKTLPLHARDVAGFTVRALLVTAVATVVMYGLCEVLDVDSIKGRWLLFTVTAAIAVVGTAILFGFGLALAPPAARAKVLRRFGREPRPPGRHALGATNGVRPETLRAALDPDEMRTR